ncbi:MAG TPA: hypothetical protein VML55_09350 [Planctomycetaceae bacterium]|nr:hypothetical protein [Planctomycetaceae bacterium]
MVSDANCPCRVTPRLPWGGWLIAAAAAVSGLTAFNFARAVQDEPATEAADGQAGLQGILPEDVPRDLDFEAFSILGGNWEQWATETTEEVARLYIEIDQLDAAAQRQVLESLGRRLKQMETAIADARYRQIYDRLITLQGNLRRRVDLLLAVLDTLDLDANAVAARGAEMARPAVLDAVSSAQSWLAGYRNGPTWTRYFRLEEMAAALRDGAAAPPEAQQVLLEVHDRLKDLSRLSPEQQQFLDQPAIHRLQQALADYAAAVEAAQQPVDRQRIRELLSKLVAAVEDYEASSSDSAAAAAREAYRDLQSAAPDGGERISAALRTHYFNYNLKIVASEAFLGRLMHDQRTEAGPVSDYVMGASVYGNQYTWTTTGVNLKPNNDDAKFDITLRGTVNSNTVGVTRQATVQTVGNHNFQATKEVRFNGYNFTTGRSRISVDANNRTVGINVRHGWVPIIGWIAQGIARREVARRQPEAEAIARSRIAERVLPEMDREVDKALDQASTDIQEDLYVRLADTGLYPQATSVKTTDDYMWLNYRVWQGGELAGGALSHTRNQAGGVTMHVHESYLNNMFDRMNFAGRTMTETEVRQELESYFSTLMGRKVDFGADEPVSPDEGPDIFTFAERDPVRVEVEAGQVNLIIRAAFRQRNGEAIPQQVVTVPLMYRIEGDQIITERGSVIVAPAEQPPSAAEQIARAGVIRKKIESSIEPTLRSRTMTFKRENDEDFSVVINRVLPLNGWVTVWGQ